MYPVNLEQAAKQFIDHFPDKSYYAIKANPDTYVLQHLYATGIKHFDVASLNEVKLIHKMFPDAHIFYESYQKSRSYQVCLF